MNRNEILAMFEEKGIAYEITEHPAVFNMEEMSCVQLPYPEADAKNLFLRDDKKWNYYLVTVKGDKKVNLKAFQNRNGTRRLSFASDEDLMKYLGLIPGSVTPLGLLNDEGCSVKLYLDEEFRHALIGVHPNENTATVWLNCDDLERIITAHGNEVYYDTFERNE